MTLKKTLVAAATTLALGTAFTANAVEFNNFYIFGDSLSDAGTYAGVQVPVSPTQTVTAAGRFTTNPGQVWAQILGSLYGFTITPATRNGTDYAEGGARVNGVNPSQVPQITQTAVKIQIDRYLAASGGKADPGALYAVWGGANDVFFYLGAAQAGQITTAQVQQGVGQAAQDLLAQIKRLADAGARYIVVPLLPDIGRTPQFGSSASLSQTGTQLSQLYNNLVVTGFGNLQGVNIIPVDTFALLNEVIANASAYGFRNATQPACGALSSLFCVPQVFVAPDAATTYVFADGVHPTSATHKILADFVKALIEGPQIMSTLPYAMLREREASLATIENQLDTARPDTGKFGAFVSGGQRKYDMNQSASNPGLDGDTNAITVGLMYRPFDMLTAGAAVTRSNGDASFGSGAGGFDLDSNTATGFAHFKLGFVSLVGTAAIGQSDFGKVQRIFPTGQVTRSAIGKSRGMDKSFSLTAALDLGFGPLGLSPFASYLDQRATVEAFGENGAGTANLKYFEQKRSSRKSAVGAKADFSLGVVKPYVKVSFERENAGEGEVRAAPLSLGENASYAMPAITVDKNYGVGQIGVTGGLGGLAWGVHGMQTFSKSDGKYRGIFANVSVAF